MKCGKVSETMPDFDREDYDELKAYKIIADMYDTQKRELNNLEKRLKDHHSHQKKIDENIQIIYKNRESDSQVFSPKKKEDDKELKKLEGRKRDVEKQITFVHERILKTRELVAEYSFVMNTLKDKKEESTKQIEMNDNFLNDLIEKVLFCKEISLVDPLRVREELDSIYKILIQLR